MSQPFAKIILPCISLLIIICSCNNEQTSGAFDDLLSAPPYASVSDSIKKEPQNEQLFFRRAVLLNKNKLPEPALFDFEKAWSIRKDERYAIAISRLLIDKSPDSAVNFLQQALSVLPNSMLLQLSLARGYDAQNKTDDALRMCEQILAKNPQQVDVLKMKADLLGKKGDENAATAVLEQAYSIVPYDMELIEILALQLAETKNPKVITLCDSLIQADSAGRDPHPYYYKGIYFSNINQPDKALGLFDEAVRRDYNFMDGYIEKGSLLYDQKKYTDALKVFNLALTISPDLPDNFYWIAKCQEALGQKQEAKLNYQRAYGLDNTFKEAKEGMDRL